MPRIARKNMTMPFFHLMTQGINKEYIFENNSEKVAYEKLILLQTEEFNVNILAYCIMDNHAHILIRVKEVENMSNFMHKINSQYATYYNKKHHRTGYVFKNRYKSQMINSLKHLYRCIDYIHDNPVKAGICETREQYKFSSYSNLYQNNQIKEECKITVVRKMGDEEIHFDSSLKIDSLEISGLDHTKNTVQDIKQKITTNLEIEIVDNKGKTLLETDRVGTGSNILVKENGIILRKYTFILYGDSNGDGKINSADLLVLQRHILEIEQIDDIYKKATNIRKNGKKPTSVDLLLIQRHILGLQIIEQ